jgi:hypothetical protein
MDTITSWAGLGDVLMLALQGALVALLVVFVLAGVVVAFSPRR